MSRGTRHAIGRFLFECFGCALIINAVGYQVAIGVCIIAVANAAWDEDLGAS